ncbi:hypothetical protein C0J52_12215, partial [Blattella germanica]
LFGHTDGTNPLLPLKRRQIAGVSVTTQPSSRVLEKSFGHFEPVFESGGALVKFVTSIAYFKPLRDQDG